MNIKRRDVLKGLRKLGEIIDGTRHKKCRIVVDGRAIGTFAIPSYEDFDDTLIGFVARPIGINNSSFRDVCGCTKDHAWYRGHLADTGRL